MFRVPEEVFEELKRWFDEKEIVELTATVAAYNCVSRFLVALDVGERNKLTGPTMRLINPPIGALQHRHKF
ncbi:hypothetical protein DID88_003275 [Monilinia fructigena]|uniref:Uncharacterized protein n=1 Tax=Monilinia fructigena TaxID=38457 RepID=A0A395IUV4_9HELO|nr:hypothetical protein DID88_003275 [Monilinia fructigena]